MMLHDGVDCIINSVVCAMRELFTPDSPIPPLGGGSDKIRVFAGDAVPTSAVDMHNQDPECGCDTPFLWVRLMRRYPVDLGRFPAASVGQHPCGNRMAVAIEVGVARCAAVFAEDCDWSAYESEAEVSLDDSRRIELALCRATALLKQHKCSDSTSIDAIVPAGPEGGVIAWLGTLFVQVDT